MSKKILKSIENLHKLSIKEPLSVIYLQRDMDKVYITNGSIFHEVFTGHKFLPVNFNEEAIKNKVKLSKYPFEGIKVPDDCEIYIRIRDKQIFFETDDYDLINIE